jgi:hypothetical protein
MDMPDLILIFIVPANICSEDKFSINILGIGKPVHPLLRLLSEEYSKKRNHQKDYFPRDAHDSWSHW